MDDFSKPLTELPSFLSTISMVVDDQHAIVQALTWAERKSPSKYDPARALFISVLEGGFTFEGALEQAKRLADSSERKCAIDVLKASEGFLKKQVSAHVSSFPIMFVKLPNNMELRVSSILVRHFEPIRLLVLHFWQTPLSSRQLSAVAAVLKKSLLEGKPEFSDSELDFVSVTLPEGSSTRRFKCYNWIDLKPFSEDELLRFWKPLMAAWDRYRRLAPRRIKRRRPAGLFG